MTVCIAALFNWNYGTLAEPKIGKALIALSDRMITAGDVEYEPQQLKTAQINPKCVVLIAGDYTVHSQALIATLRQVKFDPAVSPYNVAQIYGQRRLKNWKNSTSIMRRCRELPALNLSIS